MLLVCGIESYCGPTVERYTPWQRGKQVNRIVSISFSSHVIVAPDVMFRTSAMNPLS